MDKKALIIAEKPSAARAIAEALGGFARRQNYLESREYYLSWAMGHLVELADPEEYDPKWKRWSLATLPILPASWRLRVAAATRAQFEVLGRLAGRASRLINACDAGREGELIFRYIAEVLGVALPVQRLWVSSLTREAIRQGFARLLPGSEYDRLYQSALCRARGDWLVGMNATRAFTTRFGELLSVGRVQTPTLALLVRREEEIRQFRPEPYWQVLADFRTAGGAGYRGQWWDPDAGTDRLTTAAAAAAVAERVRAAGAGTVAAVQETDVTEKPPQLFDLTALQREANRRFGLTAAATLKAAQELYEAKLITYPRTDSRYLPRDVAAAVGRPLGALAAAPAYAPLMDRVDPQRIWNGRVVNDARVTDHHAIIPTGEAVPTLAGTGAKIFDLVARRFLANLYPDARFQDTEVITAVGADSFHSRGRVTLDPGWQAVERPAPPAGAEAAEAAAALPPLRPGEAVQVQEVAVERKQTQPPRRYTEAALLGAMEHAGREVEDEALKEAMRGRGLGTPATRAAIIERLKKVGYIETRGKLLLPTPKGERLVSLVARVGAGVLLSAELTGEWEKRIADIQAGTGDPAALLAGIRELTVQVVEQVRNAPEGAGPDPAAAPAAAGSPASGPPAASAPAGAAAGGARAGVPAGTCPRCGAPVLRRSRDWRCTGAGCTLRIPGYLCGRSIGPDLAGLLLREGRTGLVADFVSPRTGKAFAAYLVLRDTDVGFEFPADRKGRRGAPRRSGGRGGPGRGKARGAAAAEG